MKLAKETSRRFNPDIAATVSYASACLLVNDLMQDRTPDDKAKALTYIAPFIEASIHAYCEAVSNPPFGNDPVHLPSAC